MEDVTCEICMICLHPIQSNEYLSSTKNNYFDFDSCEHGNKFHADCSMRIIKDFNGCCLVCKKPIVCKQINTCHTQSDILSRNHITNVQNHAPPDYANPLITFSRLSTKMKKVFIEMTHIQILFMTHIKEHNLEFLSQEQVCDKTFQFIYIKDYRNVYSYVCNKSKNSNVSVDNVSDYNSFKCVKVESNKSHKEISQIDTNDNLNPKDTGVGIGGTTSQQNEKETKTTYVKYKNQKKFKKSLPINKFQLQNDFNCFFIEEYDEFIKHVITEILSCTRGSNFDFSDWILNILRIFIHKNKIKEFNNTHFKNRIIASINNKKNAEFFYDISYNAQQNSVEQHNNDEHTRHERLRNIKLPEISILVFHLLYAYPQLRNYDGGVNKYEFKVIFQRMVDEYFLHLLPSIITNDVSFGPFCDSSGISAENKESSIHSIKEIIAMSEAASGKSNNCLDYFMYMYNQTCFLYSTLFFNRLPSMRKIDPILNVQLL